MIMRQIERLPPARQRLLAVVLALVVVLLAAVMVAAPALERHRHYDTAIAEAAHRLERLHAAVARTPAMEAEVAARRDALRSADLFLRESSNSLAAAELQQVLRTLVEEAGGDTGSTQVMEPNDVDGFTRIGVRIRLVGDIETLRQFLHEVEARRPMLLVDDIQIQPDARRQRGGQREDRPVILAVQADISALLAPGALLQAGAD